MQAARRDAYTITALARLLGGVDRSLARRWVLGGRNDLAGWSRPGLLPAVRDDKGRWIVAASAVHRWLDAGAVGSARGIYRGRHVLDDPRLGLLTVAQVAAVLHIRPRTVRARTASGGLGCIRPPGLHRQFIPTPCVLRYIEANRRAPLDVDDRAETAAS